MRHSIGSRQSFPITHLVVQGKSPGGLQSQGGRKRMPLLRKSLGGSQDTRIRWSRSLASKNPILALERHLPILPKKLHARQRRITSNKDAARGAEGGRRLPRLYCCRTNLLPNPCRRLLAIQRTIQHPPGRLQTPPADSKPNPCRLHHTLMLPLYLPPEFAQGGML